METENAPPPYKSSERVNRDRNAYIVSGCLVLSAILAALFTGLFQHVSIVLYVVIPVSMVMLFLLFYVIILFKSPYLTETDCGTLGGHASVPGSMGYTAMLVVFSSIGWISIGLAWCVSVMYDTDGCKDEDRTRAIVSLASFGGFSIFLTGIFPCESTKLFIDGSIKELKKGRVVFQFIHKHHKYFSMLADVSWFLHYFGLVMYVVLITICLGLTADWVGDDKEAMGYTFTAVNSFLVLLFFCLKIVKHFFRGEDVVSIKKFRRFTLLVQTLMVLCSLSFWCVHTLMRINFITEVMSCVRCSSETLRQCDVGCLDTLNKVEFRRECPHCEDEFNCDIGL